MSEEQSLQATAPAGEPTVPLAGAPAETAETAAEATPLEQLGEQLILATRRAEENWDRLVRVQAEMENLRRRTEKEVADSRKFALERFAKELLVVLDSLELGIQAAAGDNAEVAKLREGNELTLKQFLAVLDRFSVQPIDPLGQRFNPELHQAMAMQPSVDAEPNTVVKVFQKGYVLNDRLLRPAMVVIAQAVDQAPHLDETA
ncbi:MAG: nucleotide exchange factor GrpE [Methylococcaceae bacterium]|nr:nucleotide exchange factor GrpE [Methylococcaceae bacterium]